MMWVEGKNGDETNPGGGLDQQKPILLHLNPVPGPASVTWGFLDLQQHYCYKDLRSHIGQAEVLPGVMGRHLGDCQPPPNLQCIQCSPCGPAIPVLVRIGLLDE